MKPIAQFIIAGIIATVAVDACKRCWVTPPKPDNEWHHVIRTESAGDVAATFNSGLKRNQIQDGDWCSLNGGPWFRVSERKPFEK